MIECKCCGMNFYDYYRSAARCNRCRHGIWAVWESDLPWEGRVVAKARHYQHHEYVLAELARKSE